MSSVFIKIVRRHIANNKEFLLNQVLAVKGLMQLLMKTRNTGEKWTREEKNEIKTHLKSISKIVPVIIIFLLPGGSVLLPVLAEVLDRRKMRRAPAEQPPPPPSS